MDTSTDRLVSDSRQYVDLKLDSLRLKAVEGLSLSLGRVLALLLLMMILSIVIASFALGGVFLLGDLVGSWAGAAFIVGGIFLILLIVVFLLRRKLFVNMFVRLFIEVFYGEE